MSQMYVDKILSGMKTEVIWSDNTDIETNTLIPVEIGNTLQCQPKQSLSIMDLGKMLLQSAKLGETSKVHELMCRGAPFTTDWLGTSPLHLAAVNNHYETCEVLLRAGISKDARTKVDRTPLHLAVYEGHEQIVELLLLNKCEVDTRDMLKMTPLHWAVQKRHKKIITMLLRHGADPCATSKFFITPLSLAIETNQQDVFNELLSWNMKQSETELACDAIQLDDFIEDSIISSPGSSSTSYPTNASSLPPELTDINDTSSNSEEQSIKPPDTDALQMLKDHGISMIDDTENTLFNSALQNGRKLVLSDAGKLLLNDLKLKKPVFAATSISQQQQAPRPPSLTSISSTQSQQQQIGSMAMPTTKTMPATIKNTIAASDAMIARNKSEILMPIKQIPLNTNKVIKILSADEFKQICKGNITSPFKKISNTAINGNVRYTTMPSSTANGLSTISKSKRFIINKATIDPKMTTKSNETSIPALKAILINSTQQKIQQRQQLQPQQQRIVPYHQQEAKLDIVSKLSTISNTPKLKQINRINTNLSILPSSFDTSSSTISSPSNRGGASESTQTIDSYAPTHQPMQLSEIERQLMELKRQTDDLRKQLELSQKQNDEYKVRLEKLEHEKALEKEERDALRFHNGSL